MQNVLLTILNGVLNSIGSRSSMKKLLKFCTIAGMALVIAACGNGEAETDTGDEAVTEETETAEEGTEDTDSEEEEGAETASEAKVSDQQTGAESEDQTEGVGTE